MTSHTRNVGGKHHLLGISLALLVMLMMALIQPVGAQSDGTSPVYDYTSCGHFENQQGAQETLDEDPALAEVLDGDGDGIACEEAFNDDGQPSVLVCNEATGTVVEVLAVAFHEGSLDFPYRQVTPAEGDSGECAAAAAAQEQEPSVDEGGIVFFCNDATGDLIEIPSGQVDQVVFDFPASRATDDEIAAGECEITAPPAAPLVVCNLRSGALVEVSQGEFDEGTIDFPATPAEQGEIDAGKCSLEDLPSCDDFPNQLVPQMVIDSNPTLAAFLDADGDGIACEPVKETDGGKPSTDKEADKDNDKDKEPMQVVALPSTGTGTGPADAQVQQSPLVAVLIVLVVGAATLRSCLRRDDA